MLFTIVSVEQFIQFFVESMLKYIYTLKKFEKIKKNAEKNEILKNCT